MYIWTMVQIYKFFAKRKSDSHKKLRFRPIHLLLTPLVPRDFAGLAGVGGSSARLSLEFPTPTTRALVGGVFWAGRGLVVAPRAFSFLCAPLQRAFSPFSAGFSRLINLPKLPKLLILPKLPTPHNVCFCPKNGTQLRTTRTPHTLPHPLLMRENVNGC